MSPVQIFARCRIFSWILIAALQFTISSRAEEGSSIGDHRLWQIGNTGADIAQFALAPTNYGTFLERFGSPDHAYYVGLSNPHADWPYVLPGTLDRWAGSFLNNRTHNVWDQMNTLPIGFVLRDVSVAGQCVFSVSLRDAAPVNPPRLRVTVNGAIFERDVAPGGNSNSLRGDFAEAKPQTLRFEFSTSMLKPGYNEITLRTTSGSWLVFDMLRLDGPVGIKLASATPTVIRSVSAAPYAVAPGSKTPATVRLEVFRKDLPGTLEAQIGQGKAHEIALEPGLQVREIAAPASQEGRSTPIRLSADGQLLCGGSLDLPAAPPVTPADYVDVFMGTEHSRWMIAPGPWMPFSMVKISPDNQIQSWCAGYEYSHDYIDCFSHIHEWTMAGLGMMPTVGALRTHPGLDETGYSSHIDKQTEHGGIGIYEVVLKDSGIKVELTATTRASLQRYTYPASDQARVLIPFLLPNEYPMHVLSAKVRRTGTNEIEGDIQTLLPGMYKCDQHYVLHFVSQFSRPFDELDGWQNLAGAEVTIDRGFMRPSGELNGWQGGEVISNAQELALSGDCGAIVRFKTTAGEKMQIRTGISLVSLENARLNLEQELSTPFGWNFDAVVKNQRNTWNDLFNRVEIETPDAREKTRFYTGLYRALSGRNIWSDSNGQWIDPESHVQQVPDSDTVMLGCDALWTTFWNLNPLMNLMAPEWSARWANSELQMYDKCGWLAKGPAGLKYIDVMVAEHEIPLMVAAYQSGLTNLDAEKILAACVKMQTTLPQNTPGGGRVGNESLESYLKYGYIAADGPLKGKTSETFEYAYDDWCVGQLALKLGRNDVAAQFLKRSQNWTNTFDAESGFIRPRKANGDWVTPFDPYHTPGFVEGNAWQYTWFVPQDMPGLAQAMGRDRFISRLNSAFEKMVPTRFNANGPGFPLNQGNETAMQAPWLFNWGGQPWLTQKWTRAVLDSYYGYNPADAYLGDDDQGQMSAWFAISALGLFQTDGGCSVNPIFEIGSPLYPKTTIHLSNKYYGGKIFTIEAHNACKANRYIQSASLNGPFPLNQWWIRQKDVLQGGRLVLELGPAPNKDWAAGCPLPDRGSL